MRYPQQYRNIKTNLLLWAVAQKHNISQDDLEDLIFVKENCSDETYRKLLQDVKDAREKLKKEIEDDI